MDLADRPCVPCGKGTPPLEEESCRELLTGLDPGWELDAAGRLVRELSFPDFAGALAYVNRVGEIAEEADHHPEIELGWGRVRLRIWTHSIDGLSENDFILAARCDRAVWAIEW